MNIFYPIFYYSNIKEIDFFALKEKGIKGIIFDIDNTLTAHGKDAIRKDLEFFDFLRELGFKTLLMSNNKEKRVKTFADFVGSEYIYNAHKPLKKSYNKALKIMNLKKEELVFIGDQIFTDILGANISGICSILVTPLEKREEIQIKIKRSLEKIILYFYQRKKI